MRIVVYSETTAGTVTDKLGLPEYSYYFILDKYRPALHALGEVIEVSDPAAEVDPLYDESRARGEDCVFLSFSPPHRIELSLRCPTVCVLAWEFDTIPDENWNPDEPGNNWAETLSRIGHVITISEYASRVIRGQTAPGTVVSTVPAPVASPGALQRLATHLGLAAVPRPLPAPRRRSLTFDAAVIDSWSLDIDSEGVRPRADAADDINRGSPLWGGHPVDWHFTTDHDENAQYLVGFYGEEEWGSWSKTSHPSVMLPWRLQGAVEVEVTLIGYAANIDRELTLRIGAQRQTLKVTSDLISHSFRFDLDEPANSIHFDDVVAAAAPGARDHRTLGIGLARLVLRRPEGHAVDESAASPARNPIAPEQAVRLDLEGTVYTSVFNPTDGRKNWHDILTAFCFAFRDDPGKTLVLKMSHHNRSTFISTVWLVFSRLSPFRCRVVIIHGFLSDDELQALQDATDYFVNTSVAEGQCLPLLEFMARGVPAIAPRHTAMEDYIHDGNALVIDASLQPDNWPMDPRRAFRTLSYRIDWEQLRLHYLESARLLEQDPRRYRAMARCAWETVQRDYTTHRTRQRLSAALDTAAKGAGD